MKICIQIEIPNILPYFDMREIARLIKQYDMHIVKNYYRILNDSLLNIMIFK